MKLCWYDTFLYVETCLIKYLYILYIYILLLARATFGATIFCVDIKHTTNLFKIYIYIVIYSIYMLHIHIYILFFSINHGSGKWPLWKLDSFSRPLFFHFHDYRRKSTPHQCSFDDFFTRWWLLSDLQLGDQEVTLNHMVCFFLSLQSDYRWEFRVTKFWHHNHPTFC